MLIHDYLEYYARSQANEPCVIQRTAQTTVELSYSEVDALANQLGHTLLERGVGLADRVAILGENSPEHFSVFMAASKIGAVAVPLNYRLAPAELAFVINDAAVKVLIVLDSSSATLEALTPLLSDDVAVFEGEQFADWIAPYPTDKPSATVDEHDAIIQLYTSGTTGNPKGVVTSHANVMALMLMNSAAAPTRSNAKTAGVLCAPLFHIGGAGSLYMGVFAGQRCLLHQQFNPVDVLNDLEQQPVNSLFVVPAMIGAMLQVPNVGERDFSALKQMYYGASPISEALLRKALEVFQCDFVQMYGMTETTGTVISLSADDHRLALAEKPELLRAAGRASLGVEAKVLDEQGKAMPTGEIGQLAIKSPSNMLGYFNLPEVTQETLLDGWVMTGDAGYIDSAGYIFLKDRIKDMVVSGGENIYPVEVENVLAHHPAIIEVAVIGVPDDKFGEALLACAVLKTDSSLTESEMIEFCRDKIAGYKIPRQLQIVEALPRNPSGKVLKKILRAPYWESHSRAIG